MTRARDDDSSYAKASRRKVCDLCFTKKIKCDMIQPVCSNCILYKSECRTTIIRRKGNGYKSKPQTVSRVQSSTASEATPVSTEERLSRIERQLQRIIDITIATGERSSSTITSSNEDDDIGPLPTKELGPDSNFNGHEQVVPHARSPEEFPLPPFEDVFPIVNHYFSVFSQIVPLFDHRSFMALLNNWYNHSSYRSSAAWAAIQVVLALSLRTPDPDALLDRVSHDRFERANLYLRNAQSVVSDLVCREEDLLGIQVLIGIALLFQSSSDSKPASVVIGTAMRLAHRLRLHSQDASHQFSSDESEQRSRVFWIAYTIDKDISLRMKAPSVQSDIDIDVPLPSLTPPDGVGLVWTQDGRSHINYHRLRVDLGHLEGLVYDLLYSNRSRKVSKEERQSRICRLQIQLDRWYSRVPAAFQIEHAASTLDPAELVMITKMHYAYLLSTIMTHGLYSHSADWIKRISSPGGEGIQDLAKYMDSCATAASATNHNPPFPGGWSRCVELSRNCMKLFEKCEPTECLIWYCICPHFSGVIILLANMFINPSHEYVSLDQHLANKATQLFDRILELFPSESISRIRVIVGELNERAFEAVDKTRAQAGPDEGFVGSFNISSNTAPENAWMPDFEESGHLLREFAPIPNTHHVSKTFNASTWNNLPPVVTEWASEFAAIDSNTQRK